MEFTNTFHVPVDIDTAFATLTDLEKVAPCLPGATLESVDGDVYRGRVKVKVGPIAVTYTGTARMVEVDPDGHSGRIEASGKETRGSGTAKADVRANLEEDGDAGTKVTVVTDLNITGKPAQFGRGVMADVGSRIIDAFAERLREMVTDDRDHPTATEQPPVAAEPAASGVGVDSTSGEAGAPAAVAGAAAAQPGGGQTAASDRPDTSESAASDQPAGPAREDDVLDLMQMIGPDTLRRAMPLVAGVAALIGLLIWWLRRR